MSKQRSIEEFRNEYLSIEHRAKGFCDELTRQIQNIVDQQQVQLGFPITARVKSWDSISEKLKRVPLNLRSITDLQDLVGVRLVFLFRRDADRMCELVKDTFTVVKSEDTRGRLKEDQFGYSSVHFVAKIPDNWLAIPSLSAFSGLIAEIQVRTVAQHLWADASHLLQYKNEANIPASVRRSIHRVSALLEIVDLEFERVLEAKNTYRQEIDPEDMDQTLNTDLLELLLGNLLPAKNKDEDDRYYYEELLYDLRHFGITTAEALTSLIESNREALLKLDADEVRKQIESGLYSVEDAERVFNTGVYYSHAGLARWALRMQFPEKWKAYIDEKAQEPPFYGIEPSPEARKISNQV